MRRLLTLSLGLYWMSVHAMLSIVCIAEPRAGVASPLALLGAETDGLWSAGGTEASAFFATIFALTAVLFLFVVLDIAGGRARHRSRSNIEAAFGVGVLGQFLLLGAGALWLVPGLFVSLESVLAALLASYLAVQFELRARSPAPKPNGVRSAARAMALGAAHNSLLPRLPAGLSADLSERKP